MDNAQKRGFLTKIQDYLDSPKGRILLNYLYSWGAAVVILGALFKLTHIEGANLMLFIGMGTEVLVFFISGFERPFIPKDEEDEEDMEFVPQRHIVINSTQSMQQTTPVTPVQSVEVQSMEGSPQSVQEASPLNVTGVEQVTADYLARIHDLTLKMEQMCHHSERMEQSTEEIELLSRNLISINTFYQMHLKSASTQMENLEKVNVQTRQMVDQIEELNRVYARMVEAMKVNSPIGTN